MKCCQYGSWSQPTRVANGRLLALPTNRVEVNGSCKHSSSLQYRNNYGRKNIYSTDPGENMVTKKSFFIVSSNKSQLTPKPFLLNRLQSYEPVIFHQIISLLIYPLH
jgi:hypothetical protein